MGSFGAGAVGRWGDRVGGIGDSRAVAGIWGDDGSVEVGFVRRRRDWPFWSGGEGRIPCVPCSAGAQVWCQSPHPNNARGDLFFCWVVARAPVRGREAGLLGNA